MKPPFGKPPSGRLARRLGAALWISPLPRFAVDGARHRRGFDTVRLLVRESVGLAQGSGELYSLDGLECRVGVLRLSAASNGARSARELD